MTIIRNTLRGIGYMLFALAILLIIIIVAGLGLVTPDRKG